MVTIGIPICNEEKYLEETLQSALLNYNDIDKIIIADNASDDRTGEIAKKYAGLYEKIIYIRNEFRIPAGENWKLVLGLAKSKYFMWLSGHDIISRDYVKVLIGKLECDDNAAVACPMIFMFENDIIDRKLLLNASKSLINSVQVIQRIEGIFNDTETCFIVNQIFRTDIIKKIMSEMKPEWVNADHIVSMYAILLGNCVSSESVAYYYRIVRKENMVQRTNRYENTQKMKLPTVNTLKYIPQEWLRLINQYVPNSLFDKEQMKNRIIDMGRKKYGAELFDSEWLMRNGIHKYEELVLDYEKIKKVILEPAKKCVIFGTGHCSNLFCMYIEKYIDIEMFIDNSSEKQGSFFHLAPIVSLDALLSDKVNLIIIIAIFDSKEEVKKQLSSNGYIYGENTFYYYDFLLKE